MPSDLEIGRLNGLNKHLPTSTNGIRKVHSSLLLDAHTEMNAIYFPPMSQIGVDHRVNGHVPNGKMNGHVPNGKINGHVNVHIENGCVMGNSINSKPPVNAHTNAQEVHTTHRHHGYAIDL